jgi:hypothetical protein
LYLLILPGITHLLNMDRLSMRKHLLAAFCAAGLFVKLTGGRVPVLEVCLVRSAISFALAILLMKSARMQGPVFGQRSNLLLLTIRGGKQLHSTQSLQCNIHAHSAHMHVSKLSCCCPSMPRQQTA